MARSLTNTKIDHLHRVAEQEEWIEDHGGNLAGYIARYGSATDPGHYGNGGEAIYKADLAHLDKVVAEARTAKGA